MPSPFVGRQRELEELVGLLRHARQQRGPGAAIVTGQAGSGKTRLLREALRRSSVDSVRVLGFEPSQSVPFAAVGDLIRQLANVPRHGEVLQTLVFGGSDLPVRESLRIFEAAHRALASFGPLMVAIDDLQWLDESSLALMRYLLRAADSTHQPLVVFAVARPSPGAAAFRSSLEADMPIDRLVSFELGPLPLSDGLSLARNIDADLDEASAIDLWERAQGSPFWLEALVRGGGAEDPSSLMHERLRGLSSVAGTMLALLAVGARPFSAEYVAQALSWEGDQVRFAVRELTARGLAIEVGGSLSLAHDLIREAVTASMPRRDRRQRHALVADLIEAGAADDLPMLCEALEHRQAGGLPTAALASRILASPQRRLLGTENLRLLASISDAVEPGTTLQIDLDSALGELAADLGDPELALDRWARVSRHSPDANERQHAEIESAGAAYMLRQGDAAHAHIDRARSLAPVTPEIAVRLDALQAEVELWLDHETALGRRTADRAFKAARKMALAAGGLAQLTPSAGKAYIASLAVVTDAAMQEDRLTDVLRFCESYLLAARRLDDESYLEALMRIGFALQPTLRIGEREARFREAWVLAERLVMPAAMVEAGHGLTRSLGDQGRLLEAHDIAARTAELETRLKDAPRRWGNALGILHFLELSLGDPSTALEALRRVVEEEPDPHYRVSIHQRIAEWRARFDGAGMAREVDAQLVAARAASSLARCPRCAAELSVVSAELLARTGRVDDAKAELAAWEEHTPSGPHALRELWRTRARAAIAAADGDDAGAASILEAFCHELEQIGLLGDLLWARLDLGRVLAGIDRDRSIQAFASAAELAQTIGARSQERLAAQALRRSGVRAWRRGRATGESGLASLSNREREVAHLVADGASNREVAEALLVSPKTIERHLTNILAKVGLRNRTELAGLLSSTLVRDSPDE